MIEFNKLIQSVTYYLSYQDKIGRSFMIDESSLKYPVADYLSSLEMPLYQIALEYAHPHLKKRQIDLVTTDKTRQQIKRAFEFKMSRSNTKYESEQKRVFNDLMRLYLLSKHNNSDSYFIMAGKQSDFIQYFRSIVTKKPVGNSKDLPKPEGFYTEWFKFNLNDTSTFNVKSVTGNEYGDIYKAFLNDYKPHKNASALELPDKLTTKCIAISPLSREFPTPYVGGIWQVQS